MSDPSDEHNDELKSTANQAISRRDFLKLAGLGAAGAIVAGCRPAPASSTRGSSGPVRLVYQDWRTEWFAPMAQQMLEEFHASHPNIRVYFTPDPEGLRDVMPGEFEAGTAPDVFQGCCDYFPAWAQKGYVLDLSSYVSGDLEQETIADWDPAQYRALFTRQGVQFALPKYHGALALYFNKDLFDEYGIEYPNEWWSYEDYLQAMKQLTRDRDGDGRTDLWGSMLEAIYDRIQIHVNAWGGHFVDLQDPFRCRMASPEAVDSIEWLRARIWDDQVMATPLTVQKIQSREAFYTQRVGMIEDGSWALKDILVNANFRIGVSPLPSGPVRRATLATTDGFGIFAGTKYPDAAWELIKFLTSKSYGRAMARTNFLQPARASLVDEWVGFIKDEYPGQAQEMDLSAFADGHLKGYSFTAEVFANMTGVRKITDTAFEEILTLGQAPTAERMAKACEEITQIQQTAMQPPIGDCCSV